MALTRSGDQWHGETHEDLVEYFHATADGYPVDHVRESVCAGCGGRVFVIEFDESGSNAHRTCTSCGQLAYFLDSEEWWHPDPAEAKAHYILECPSCENDEFEAAVGFELHQNEIRDMALATRCTEDGLLGYCLERRNRVFPSLHLLDKA
ncbi:hypothetical protein LWC34_24840 [Kibdelosporangium philippinense]|uniref:Uncharacterized protein n=1 Tax=Kibdelosporangium philippinense TaxID=211113 RepID=A0ABS8ZE28_9PSEU|nr:hypothetical protein [Kibdelosporangium philippinense]MCE7006035.1 hypothetical protein [Kibdelosporangium philippinense]